MSSTGGGNGVKARNRTRKANPAQLTIANEYRGTLRKSGLEPTPGNLKPPQYEGTCTLNGDSYWISGWIDKRGPAPTLQLVFQLAVRGTKPVQHQPEDLRLNLTVREGPTQRDLDWTHYMQAPREHRESGECEKCNRIHADLDARFGAEAPWNTNQQED